MKRITFCLIITLCSLLSAITAQTKKSFKDTDFVKGDIIKVPNIEVEVLNSEIDVQNDSLELLVTFLNQHINLKVEIACHTDSRGNLAGNLQSSQYRAQGIRNYLIKNKNIAPERLVAKGYGESQLIIPDTVIANAKTKEEKEKLHSINRRIELIVLN